MVLVVFIWEYLNVFCWILTVQIFIRFVMSVWMKWAVQPAGGAHAVSCSPSAGEQRQEVGLRWTETVCLCLGLGLHHHHRHHHPSIPRCPVAPASMPRDVTSRLEDSSALLSSDWLISLCWSSRAESRQLCVQLSIPVSVFVPTIPVPENHCRSGTKVHS